MVSHVAFRIISTCYTFARELLWCKRNAFPLRGRLCNLHNLAQLDRRQSRKNKGGHLSLGLCIVSQVRLCSVDYLAPTCSMHFIFTTCLCYLVHPLIFACLFQRMPARYSMSVMHFFVCLLLHFWSITTGGWESDCAYVTESQNRSNAVFRGIEERVQFEAWTCCW